VLLQPPPASASSTAATIASVGSTAVAVAPAGSSAVTGTPAVGATITSAGPALAAACSVPYKVPPPWIVPPKPPQNFFIGDRADECGAAGRRCADQDATACVAYRCVGADIGSDADMDTGADTDIDAQGVRVASAAPDDACRKSSAGQYEEHLCGLQQEFNKIHRSIEALHRQVDSLHFKLDAHFAGSAREMSI
jgi:hypothetical protein